MATDPELLESAAHWAKLARLAQAELTKHAGEIARRSETRDDTSLARRMGASGAAHLVSQVTGVPRTQAGTMVASGVAFRPGESMTGEPLPAKYAQIAAAFADGLLDPEIAAAMRRALDKAAPGLAPYEVDELEPQVVAQALEGYDPDLFLSWLKKVPQHAHPDGGAPNPDEPDPGHLGDAAGVAERVDPVGAGTRPPDRRVLEVRGGCEHGDEAVHHHHPGRARTRTRRPPTGGRWRSGGWTGSSGSRNGR